MAHYEGYITVLTTVVFHSLCFLEEDPEAGLIIVAVLLECVCFHKSLSCVFYVFYQQTHILLFCFLFFLKVALVVW